MTMSGFVDQREHDKFVETSNGLTSVRVSSIGGLLDGIDYDYISIAYPTDTTEVYSYKKGGVSGDVVVTITLTYTDSGKSRLSSVVKS